MENKKHAIVVIPSGIKQNSLGKWESTELSEKDNQYGSPGGKLRVLAVALLSERHPDAVVVTHGGLGYDIADFQPKERPMISEILRDELIEQGVHESRIILESYSNTTFQGLTELLPMIDEHGFKKITFITNRYHVPRLKLMIRVKFEAFHDQVDVEVLSAEDILIAHEPESWEKDRKSVV